MNSTNGEEATPEALNALDISTLVLYFLVLAAIAVWSSRKQTSTTDSYFLAGKHVGFLPVAASLLCSNIGSEHLVGLAASGATNGIAVAWFEWGACLPLLALGFVFLPLYVHINLSTMPEYVERRFGRNTKLFVVFISIFLYVLTKIAATLYAGIIILQTIVDVNEWLVVAFLILGTGMYAIGGGLEAVVYSEVLQTLVLLSGGVLLAVEAMREVGGLDGLRDTLPRSHLRLMRSDGDLPASALLTGYWVLSLWYWATDQVIVQRTLAAADIRHGRLSCVVAGMLKMSTPFLMVLPGMAARVLMDRDGVLAIDAEDPSTKLLNRAYPYIVLRVLPKGLHGVIIAAAVSSLMSSLASVLNSSATIFTLDVYKRLRPTASDRRLVWVGRVTVAVICIASLLWLPIIPLLGDDLFVYIQKPPACVAPGILCVFVWGAFSMRANSNGALAALAIGTSVGALRFFMEVGDAISTSGKYDSTDSSLGWFVQVHFLHFAALQFLLCSAVMFGVSWWKPDGDGTAEGLLWSSTLYGDLLAARVRQTALSTKPSPRSLSAAAAVEFDTGDIELTEVSLSQAPPSPQPDHVDGEALLSGGTGAGRSSDAYFAAASYGGAVGLVAAVVSMIFVFH